MALPPETPAVSRPVKDEWGVYDPEQAGLAAVFARLDRRALEQQALPAAPDPAKLLTTSLGDGQ